LISFVAKRWGREPENTVKHFECIEGLRLSNYAQDCSGRQREMK
jgi:hypothetical protein